MEAFASKRPLETKTMFVALFCLTGTLFGLWRLYLDFQITATEQAGEGAGIIERKEEYVRRKLAKNFQWFNVEPEEKIYTKDSIQTGPNSSATIKLKNGVQLEIGENSLYVLEDNVDVSLGFLQGSVVIRDEKGDRAVQVAADGKKTISELKYRMMAPVALETFFVESGERKKIDFAWKPTGSIESNPEGPAPFIEIQSLNQRSQRQTEIIKTDFNQHSAEMSLAEGSYTWQFKQATGEALTQKRRFKILGVTALQPVWPMATDAIRIFGNAAPLRFTWQASGNEFNSESLSQGKHKIEIASDSQFGKMIRVQPISAESGSATMGNLNPGVWYWRIKSEYGGLLLVSRAQKFSIETKKSLDLKLTSPKAKSAVEKTARLKFQWSLEGNPPAQFQINLEEVTTQKLISSQKVNTPIWLWEKVQAGVFRAQVSAYIDEQLAGQSEWQSFSVFEGAPIDLLQPKPEERILFWQKPSKVDFQWKGELGQATGAHFVVEVASDNTFASLLKTQSSDENDMSLQVKEFPSGTYYWRVRVLDGAGELLRSSSIGKFYFDYNPPLPAPEVVSGRKFNLRTESEIMNFKWLEVKEAKEYEYNIEAVQVESLDSNFDSSPRRTRDNEVKLRDLKPGTYKLSVKAIDPINRAGQVTSIQLIVDLPRLEAPKVKSRVVQ